MAAATGGGEHDPVTAPGAWTVVVDRPGATAGTSANRVRAYGRLAVIAAVVIVVVAVLSVFAARHLAEDESVSDAAKTADVIAEGLVQPAVLPGLATGDPAALASIDTVVRDHILGDSIVRVKIWDASGRVLYSDEPRLIGETFALEEEELEVLEHPRTAAEVSDVQAPENRYEKASGTLLEVYRPIWASDGQPLLFETYFRYTEVVQRSGAIWQGFAAVTVGSILLMVVLLLPVLRSLVGLLARTRAQREVLLQRSIDASAAERRRIAGTLHDGVVQQLAATSFTLAGLSRTAASSGDAASADALDDAAGSVRASIGGLRSLLVDIYPPSLERAGLAAAVDDLASVLRSRGVAVTVKIDAAAVLDAGQEQLVFRVTQEALRNVASHANADSVTVSLRARGAGAVLEVHDDGRGFDAAETLANPRDGHFGVRVIADLAASADCRLSVLSAPGSGVTWRLELGE